MNIKIDYAKTEDLKDIQNLNLLLFQKEKEEYDLTFNLSWTFSSEGANYFSNAIEDNNSCVLIVRSDKQIVGYLAGKIKITQNTHRTLENQAELENMMILAEYRNMQIGTKLVEKFFSWAKDKDIKNIKVTASSKNEKAINFYKKCGFKDYDHTLEINF